MKKLFFTVVIVFVVLVVHAQSWTNLSVDEMYQQAREKAFDGKREEAREMLSFALERSPDYHDLRILLARTYAWDGRREEARVELKKVLAKSPENEDALNALTDVELWDERYEDLLALTEAAQRAYPSSEDFLYKRAVALHQLTKDDEAIIALNRLLGMNPSHKSGGSLLKEIKTAKLKYTVGAGYNLDLFSKTFDPAHYGFLQIGRTNSWGSSILRFNYANRFALHGLQSEVDLYPRIADGVYAYLNYGFSDTDLFPRHRIGAELFSKLPAALEASAGVRYLNFDKDTRIIIYTGSFGWYVKSYWISIRPYITPDKETGTSFSASLVARKYFSNRDHYLGITVGLGYSPDERRFQTTSGFTSDGIYVLKSQRVGISWSKELPRNYIINAVVDLTRQELIFDEGEYMNITSLSLGFKKRI